MKAFFIVWFLVVACERPRDPGPAFDGQTRARASATGAGRDPGPRPILTEITWRYSDGPFGATEVVVAIPAKKDVDERFPVLVLFHGRGEALKSPHRGARGWLDDYGLERAVQRLSGSRLTSDDFLGFVAAERLLALNARLEQRPYRGLILVCPYLADRLRGRRAFREGKALADFVADRLLPRVRRETPAMKTAAATGVDGVSLGGRAALLVGLGRPEAFGSVGALQPAVDPEELDDWVELALSTRERSTIPSVRLLSSDGDYFLGAIRELHRAWDRAGFGSTLEVVRGPHSYAFNRGPGVFEALLYHDQALRR